MAVPRAPLKTGVEALVAEPAVGAVTVTAGAVRSTVKDCAGLVPTWPRSSDWLTVTV